MPFSGPDDSNPEQGFGTAEPRDFAQLGLDFGTTSGYSDVPRKETDKMNQELFETLDKKVGELLEKYTALKAENARLAEENQRFLSEREGLKSRVDTILGKLEGI